MSKETFDRLRLPIALGLGLLLIASFLLLRRAETGPAELPSSPDVVVGAPGGGLLTPVPSTASTTAVPTASATPQVTPSPIATPPPTPPSTPQPTPVPQFAADVLACESISESECNGEIRRLRDRDETFVALVLFSNAQSGDVMNAILEGPSDTREGGAYTLPGSGRGYYYSTFFVGDLPRGDYVLIALRNGEEIARTELRKDRGGGNDDDDD